MTRGRRSSSKPVPTESPTPGGAPGFGTYLASDNPGPRRGLDRPSRLSFFRLPRASMSAALACNRLRGDRPSQLPAAPDPGRLQDSWRHADGPPGLVGQALSIAIGGRHLDETGLEVLQLVGIATSGG